VIEAYLANWAMQRRHHRLTDEEKKRGYFGPMYDFVSMDRFSIRPHNDRTYVEDTATKRVEEKLNDLMVHLINRAFREREENRRREIRAAEEATRAARRAEIEELRRVESAEVKRLLENAANWKKAEDLRAFIAAVKAFPSFDHARGAQLTRWLRWAKAEADQLDPFGIAPDDVLEVDFEALARLEKLTRDDDR
jgi:DNA phosphorothioation-dependent restriction protein DptG